MIHDEPQTGDMAKVTELIWSIRIALLTTADPQGRFHTRPVETLQIERGEVIWFFTGWSSPKVDELLRDRRVSLGYAAPDRRVYLAVSGSAGLLRDPRKARELWTQEQRAYYPNGPGDERLALLRVRIERAEYWIAPSRATYLVAAERAAATGKPADVLGENHRIRGINRSARDP